MGQGGKKWGVNCVIPNTLIEEYYEAKVRDLPDDPDEEV